MEYTRENVNKCDLLQRYLLDTNQIYNTKKEMRALVDALNKISKGI